MGGRFAAREEAGLRLDRARERTSAREFHRNHRTRRGTGELLRADDEETPGPDGAVLVEPGRTADLGDHQVEVAVPIPVAGSEAPPDRDERSEVAGIHFREDTGTVAGEDLRGFGVLRELAGSRDAAFPRHRAVHQRQVEIAVVVEVAELRSETGQAQAGHSQTRLRRVVAERSVAEVAVERVRLCAQVGHEQVEVPVPVRVAERHAHARLGAPLPVQRGAEEERRVAEGAVFPLFPQEVRFAVVRHIEVEPAVAGEVVAEDAERRQPPGGDTRSVGRILELPAPDIAPEGVACVVETLRRTEVPFAGCGNTFAGRVVHQVTAHIEV